MGAYPVKFGKYLLLERVNVGGMAEVFKAKTFGVAGFERILAIKRILPSLVEDDEFIRMFIDEARIAVQLNHANIVQIYELGKHGDHYYIAMEYLPSRDLRGILDRLRAGGQLMPIAQAAFVTSKVCEGLDYAHRRRDPSGEPMNIIHRDVSPQNILITYEGDIKVIDFGIAKAANRASKTQAGVLKGKFGYMSPEQVRGLPIDRRSDIFAVGVLLYEMLTGERLFIGESDFSTLERVRNAEVVPPTTFNKKITPELEQIVLKALAREAEDRYQWASDLAEDLQSFLIEDRSIYNPKRLGLYMKDIYAGEIAAERAKMEEYLSLAMEGTPNEVVERSIDSLPSPYVEVKAHAPVETNTDPLPPADDGIDFNVDEADEFEEDKTFVIEASEAGKVLQKSVSDSGDALVDRSDPSLRAPRVPENTGDDFLTGASLYGEEASDLEDDAATMVSVANPFDENRGGTDPGGEPNDGKTSLSLPGVDPASATHAGFDLAGGTNPSARGMAPPSVTHHDAAVSMASEPSRGAGSMTGDGPPSLGSLASGVSGPIPADPDEPTRAAPSDAGFGEPPRAPERGGPPPTLQYADSTERAPRAPEPPPSMGMSRGVLTALIAGVAVAFLAFAGVAIGVIVKLVSDDTVPIVLAPPDPANPPTSVKVFVDGELVAQALPAQVLLASSAGQVLRVEADGYQPLELPLPQVDAALSPLTLPMQRTAPQAPDGAAGDAATPGDDPKANPPDDAELAVAAKDPAAQQPDAKAPSGEDRGAQEAVEQAAGDDALAAGDTAPATDGKATPTTALAAVASGPPWRVSFTTVAAGAPVHGARVLRDGALVGTTPFEIELAANLERVSFEVRADGYASKQLDISRAGRDAIGPATVRLEQPPAAGARGDAAPPEDENPTADDEVAAGDGAAATAMEQGDDGDTAAAEESPDASKDDGTKVASASTDKADSDQARADKARADKANADKANADKARGDKGSGDKARGERASADKAAAKDDAPDRSSARSSQRQQKRARDKRVELSLGTRPFAHVIVDGRKLPQTTPLMGARALKLRPGDHIIQFIDTKTNKKYRYRVSLPESSPKNKLIIILGGDIRVREGKAKAVELR